MSGRMLTLEEMRAIWGPELSDDELIDIARRAYAWMRVFRETLSARTRRSA